MPHQLDLPGNHLSAGGLPQASCGWEGELSPELGTPTD